MTSALILLKQIAIMFLLSFVGFALFRTGKISKEGSRSIANLLIFVSIPFSIINGFLIEKTPEKLIGFAASAGMAVVLLVLSIFISRLFFRKDPIASFGAAFSNAGFIGIPLILDVLGPGAVFYIASLIAILNLLQWTYGVAVLTGKKSVLQPKAVLTAPFMIAILVGGAIFIGEIPLPSLATQAVSQLAGLNTALAMFSVGIYLAEVDIKRLFSRRENYLVALVRLILIPVASMLVLTLLPAQFSDMRMALFIAAACPVGSNVAVYAQLHDMDYSYAVETVIITTLFSVVSLPGMVYTASLIW